MKLADQEVCECDDEWLDNLITYLIVLALIWMHVGIL